MKRIISILLGIAILCQLTVVSVSAKNSVPETSVLSELDIISKDIKEETVVTRIELARILAKILYKNMTLTGSTEGYYVDVPYTKEDAGILSMLSQQGIMSGIEGGRFDPDGTLKLEQCMKVMMVILGYGLLAGDKGGYPQGYMAVAAEQGVLDGITITDNDITYGILRKILCNVMGAKVMVTKSSGIRPIYEISDETFMENVMGMIKVDGIVKGTGKAALTNSSFCGTEEVNIDNNSYLTGKDWNLDEYVGFYVHAYFTNDDDDQKLLSISRDDKRNNTLVINSKDIESFENRKIKYWLDGKKSKNATLDSMADIIQGGTPVENYSSDVFDFDDGTITLIDNDNDNIYEVVKLECTYNTVVAGINTGKSIIYDMYNSNNTIDLSSSEYTMTDSEGHSIRFEDLKQGNVLTWSVSGDGDTYSIIVAQDNIVAGTVTGINTSSGDAEIILSVDNVDYIVAPSYSPYCKSKIKNGEGITLYMDYKGRIAGSTNKSNALSEWKYGFLINSYFHESGEKLFIKLYSEDDMMIHKEVSNKLQIDYVKYKDKAAMNNELATLKNQIVRYKINSKDIITAIDSLKPDTVDGSLIKKYSGTTPSSFRGGGVNSFMGLAAVGPNTKVFIVRGDDGSEEYSVKDYTYFEDATEYTLSTYGSANSIVSDAALLYKTDAGKKETGFIVSIEGTGIDKDDEPVGLITVFVFDGKQTEKTYEVNLKNVAMDDLKEGQIISYICNGQGQIDSTELMLDYEEGKKQGFWGIAQDTGITYRVVYGKAGMMDDEQLLLIDDDADSVVGGASEIHNTSLYKIYVYDKSERRNKVRTGTSADIYDYKSLGDMCSRVVVYSANYYPRVMIIYNE